MRAGTSKSPPAEGLLRRARTDIDSLDRVPSARSAVATVLHAEWSAQLPCGQWAHAVVSVGVAACARASRKDDPSETGAVP